MPDIQVPSLRLTPKQEKAAYLIANGKTQKAAASAAGVSKVTVNAWMKKESFQQRINELRLDLDKQADEILAVGVIDAAKTVTKIASGKFTIDHTEKRTSELPDGTETTEEEFIEGDFSDTRALNARLKAALWLLDMRKKGKIPPASGARPHTNIAEDVADSADDEESKEMLERGKQYEDDEEE
jgi:transcriptional regulator with XRE-family HTH domain